MATLLGTDLYRQETSTNPAALPDNTAITGEPVRFTAKYVPTGAEVTLDVLPIVRLPLGATLITESMRFSSTSVGGTTVAFSQIGDAGSAARYSATSIPLTANQTGTAITPTNAIMVTPFKIITEANRDILATMTHAGAPSASGAITITGYYLLK